VATTDARAAREGHPPHVDEPEEKTEGRQGRKIGLGTFTALLALATSGVSLLFTFVPGWRPDPRVIQAANLQIAAVERGVMLREYARRTKQASPNRLEGCIPGNLYYVSEHLEGFKDRRTVLVYVLYDAATGHPIRHALGTVAGASASLRSTRPTDQSISLAWTQWPDRIGRYFVRFELYRKGTLLDLADSHLFRVRKGEYTALNKQCLTAGG
jgi:hypothetical protein